jgi:hypothetical protein
MLEKHLRNWKHGANAVRCSCEAPRRMPSCQPGERTILVTVMLNHILKDVALVPQHLQLVRGVESIMGSKERS